ncbi:MAG: hypothetical protein HYU67_04575 [Flavobacteriia bacterium]|nr:hypothetical protein [Flavobacteriia bacterium]
MEQKKLKSVADYIQKVADMESDVKTTIKVFARLLKSFGIDEKTFEEGVDLAQFLPQLVGRISKKMLAGTFDTKALADLSALVPIFEKYQYLKEDFEK